MRDNFLDDYTAVTPCCVFLAGTQGAIELNLKGDLSKETGPKLLARGFAPGTQVDSSANSCVKTKSHFLFTLSCARG